MGGSLLSLVEIFYHFVFKQLFENWRGNRKSAEITNEDWVKAGKENVIIGEGEVDRKYLDWK